MCWHYLQQSCNFSIFRWSLSSVGLIQPVLTLVKGFWALPPLTPLLVGPPFSQGDCIGRLPIQPCITFMHVATLNSYFTWPAHAHTDTRRMYKSFTRPHMKRARLGGRLRSKSSENRGCVLVQTVPLFFKLSITRKRNGIARIRTLDL